jgi:hypothetical protein
VFSGAIPSRSQRATLSAVHSEGDSTAPRHSYTPVTKIYRASDITQSRIAFRVLTNAGFLNTKALHVLTLDERVQ